MMERRPGILRLCMIFGVMVIMLAGSVGAVSALPDPDSKIGSSLLQEMKERPDGKMAVIVEMKGQQTVSFDVKEAKSSAIKSQEPLTASLETMRAENVKHLWIVNAVSATVPAQKIDEIAARPDVKKLWLDKKIRLIEPIDGASGRNQSECINKLYLRHNFKHPYDDYLSEYPETSYGVYTDVKISDDGDSHTWDGYYLDGDITGTNYSYGIYFASGTMSGASTTFGIEIIIDGTTVAAFPNITVEYDPLYYRLFSEEMTGMDPATSRGDEVILKITKISGDTGWIWFGTDCRSNIIIPCISDYGDANINAPSMWDLGYQGSDIKIAILDTGIDDTHPDLEGKVISEYDYTDDGTTDDLYGHGTHCAGIAAGKHNATTDVTGVAPDASLLNAKVLNKTGYGNTSWILEGIQWSMDQNADILSMSFGGHQMDGTGRDLESMAVTNAVNAGYIVVVAAGNEGPGEGTIGSPAVGYGAITVAASDSGDAIMDFSSRGPCGDGRVGIDIAAPGYKIIAPNAFWENETDYMVRSGTSMSGPHVAGAAALLLQADPGLTPGEVERALKNGADINTGSKVVYYAFDLDDINNITIQRQLIENSENWLRVVENPTGSVLIIDDGREFYSHDDQSVNVLKSAFEGLGYDVRNESSDETSYSTWGDYDIVVWSCGDEWSPISNDKYKKMLVDYVTDGGHLVLEGGNIATWIRKQGTQVIDRELREKVLHVPAEHVYSDVGDLKLSTEHPIATTPNVLPETIDFTPTNPGDESGDADAVRILPDAVGIYNWSDIAYGGNPVNVIAYGLIAHEKRYDVREQGSGRADVKDAYDALTTGTIVDSHWFVGTVRSGSYTKTFTVMNNNVTGKTVNITGSTGDAGDWITLPANLTVPAGGTATFDATMNVPDDAIGAYKGSIRVNDGIEDIIIPVSLNVIRTGTRTGCITGSVDEDFWYDAPNLLTDYGGDWVYYTLDVLNATNLSLSLDWTNSNNNLDLILFDHNGTFAANASEYDKPEMITVENPISGNWTVAINAYKLQTAPETYTLEITMPTLRGDVNHDGVITPADAVIALEIAAGSHPFDPAADVSGDDQVTSIDALMILQAAAGDIEL